MRGSGTVPALIPVSEKASWILMAFKLILESTNRAAMANGSILADQAIRLDPYEV